MPTYDSPSGFSRASALADAKRRKLEAEIEQGRLSQRVNKVFGQFTPEQRAGVQAIDALLNMKEQEAELEAQKVANAYPAGTTVGGLASQNIAGYGQTPQMPIDPAALMQARQQEAKGAAPFPMVPNPLYREGGILPKMVPSDLAAQLMKQMPK